MLLDINHVQANRNMKHYYKTLKHKTEFKWAMKNNSKTKQTDMHIKLVPFVSFKQTEWHALHARDENEMSLFKNLANSSVTTDVHNTSFKRAEVSCHGCLFSLTTIVKYS